MRTKIAIVRSGSTQLIFTWVNNTRFPFSSSDDYLGIKTKVHKLGTELYGIDPRILEITDNKFLVVYSLFGKHVGKGCIVVAGYEKNLTSDSMEFYLTPRKVFLDVDRNSRQKNWMPFVFNNTPHFVQRYAKPSNLPSNCVANHSTMLLSHAG